MSEFVSEGYQRRLDELAERLMTERFIRSLGDEAVAQFAQPVGAEAVNGMFVQDALLEAEDC